MQTSHSPFLSVFFASSFTTDIIISRQACERSSVQLECEPGKAISVISAMYGRQSLEICPNGPIQLINTTSCAAANSLTIVRQKCNGYQTCDILAGNGVFGDPCYAIIKYLSIDYKCEGKQKIIIPAFTYLLSVST